MSKTSFHLRTFELMISNFQSTVLVFSVKLVKLPNPAFVLIWILLISKVFLFTCLKTLHVLNSVSFRKDQRCNSCINYLWIKSRYWMCLDQNTALGQKGMPTSTPTQHNSETAMSKSFIFKLSLLPRLPQQIEPSYISDSWIQAWKKCPALQTSRMSWWVVTCSQNTPEALCMSHTCLVCFCYFQWKLVIGDIFAAFPIPILLMYSSSRYSTVS